MPRPASEASLSGAEWRRKTEDALAAAGHRSGGARGAVIELLSGRSCALSAQEIADELSSGGASIGLASVYRALDLLSEHGLLQRLDLPEGGSRYEPALAGEEHHHHAVCEVCGGLTPFEDQGLERAIEQISDRIPHRVTAHDVVIRGVCRRCQRGRSQRLR